MEIIFVRSYIIVQQKKQLLRLRAEIEATCKHQNVYINTNIKRFKYQQYIEQLSRILDNQTKKQSSDLFSSNSTLQINTNLISMLKNNEVSNTTKKFIQQAINFENYMFKLNFGQCCICHQRQLNMNTLNGMFKLSIEKTQLILFS